MRSLLALLLLITGAVLAVVGVAVISVPAAVVVCGVGLAATGLLLDDGGKS